MKTKATIAREEAFDLGYEHGMYNTYLPKSEFNRAQVREYDKGFTSGRKHPRNF